MRQPRALEPDAVANVGSLVAGSHCVRPPDPAVFGGRGQLQRLPACLPACLPPSCLRTLCRARLSWLGGGAPARRCWHCAGSCGQTAAASEPSLRRVRARSRGARRPPASVAQQLLLGWWEMAARRVGNAADMQGAGAGIAALLHVVPLYDVCWSWRHGDAPWPDPGVCRAQALDGTCAPSSQHAAWPWRTPDAHVALGFSSTAGRG
jgi:hypothetical protein